MKISASVANGSDQQFAANRPAMQLLPALAEDVVLRDAAQNQTISGRSATQHAITQLVGDSFTHIRAILQAIRVSEDQITLQLAFSGRHTGYFAGIPPTERPVRLPVTVRCNVRNGRVHRIELDYDAGELLRQLGLIRTKGDE